MAALLEPAPKAPAPDLLDLRLLNTEDLEPLLEDERRTWADTLDWDFTKSADLVRRFVSLRALNGFALLARGEAVGYTYFVLEEHKGLIGDLYVRRDFRRIENENQLLQAALDALTGAAHVRRIESQLMLIDSSPGRPVPGSRFLQVYGRKFMTFGLERLSDLPAHAARHPTRLQPWDEQYQEAAAHLIAASYLGHIDSRINDQYRSVAGARRFLFNIVQYPGCGSFFQPASFVALDPATGRMLGLSLTSMVGAEAGHITQICVTPEARGAGIGFELLRQSLATLQDSGCRYVSLTVTAANRDAVRLYENMGFATIRRFSAYVWEGFA